MPYILLLAMLINASKCLICTNWLSCTPTLTPCHLLKAFQVQHSTGIVSTSFTKEWYNIMSLFALRDTRDHLSGAWSRAFTDLFQWENIQWFFSLHLSCVKPVLENCIWWTMPIFVIEILNFWLQYSHTQSIARYWNF